MEIPTYTGIMSKTMEVFMPFSDLFRKPKKETADTTASKGATPSTDETFLSPEMQKKRSDAALEFVKAFQEKIPLVGGKPHAGTVLAVASRLAGSSLYRALNKQDVTPGVVVLSEEVNQAWPQLMNLFALYCKQNGTDVMSKPVVTDFPEQNKPLMSVEQVLTEYQDQYLEIMKRHGLDYLNAARAGMVVSSIVFEYHCKTVRDIDPFVAAGIVAMGIVEGAKTAPPPLRTKSSGSSSNPAAGNSSRLVLGERESAIQEALSHGGEFIDPHPEVFRMLQEKGIDPFLIYQQGLINKIHEKVARIDFVKANVDELFNIWQGKSDSQTPIHVRLIGWLKENAASHGYEQQGNSWVRKQ